MSSPASSSARPTWQRAWDDAQTRISGIRDSLTAAPAPSPRILRVGKVDAELLDAELVHVLQEPITRALGFVNPALKAKYSPELTLLLQAVLYKFSVWDQGASYGAKLQGLKYETSGSTSRLLAASGLPAPTLLLHGTFTIVLPYLHTRLRAHALSRAWPDAPSSDRRRKAWELLSRLESLHGVLGLANFIVFLGNGRYRMLADRLLGLRLVLARRILQREVSYEFMNRQMVWHAFTEFLLFLLPLINTRALRRQMARIASSITASSLLPAPLASLVGSSQFTGSEKGKQRGKYWMLPREQCAICAERASTNLDFSDPSNALNAMSSAVSYGAAVTARASEAADALEDNEEVPRFPTHTPYAASCGHIYCYYCLTERMMRTADDRTGTGKGGMLWECLRCSEGVTGAERVEADVEGPEYESGVDDGSDDDDVDFTDSSLSFNDSLASD